MSRLPPRSTPTHTLFPYPPRVRSLPYHGCTEATVADYQTYVSLGNSFSWDLSQSDQTEAMRLQLVHDIKALLTVSGSVSLEGLNLFLSGTANNLTPEQLGVYDNGNIKIVTITGADGQALNASSSDLECLQGTITFDGSVYAQEQQMKD